MQVTRITKSRLWGGVAGFTLFAAIGALAAGLYTNNLPFLVGNPNYSGFTTQAPISLSGGAFTGNEAVPLDTNLPGGAAPQTAATTLYNLWVGTLQSATNTAAFTATAAQVCGGGKQVLNLTGTLGAGAAVTTPTAAACLANLPAGVGTPGGTPQVGYTWLVKYVNSSSGAFAWTVTAGTGFTFNGPVAIAQGASATYSCAVTSSTAVACTYIGAGL